MARSLILTGWSGETYAEMATHTVPLMHAYAAKHGHDFRAINLTDRRPASWQKLPALSAALSMYEVVAWLDVDVVIVSQLRDVIAELEPDKCQAVVEHLTDCGRVPNCGVWVVSRGMDASLQQAWEDGAAFVHHPWWEQAAIMRLMGYAVDPGPRGRLDTPTSLYGRTTFLRPEWNHHPADVNRPDEPYFVHVTQYADRLRIIRELSAAASGA